MSEPVIELRGFNSEGNPFMDYVPAGLLSSRLRQLAEKEWTCEAWDPDVEQMVGGTYKDENRYKAWVESDPLYHRRAAR